jgi:hypothetical protein
MKHRMETALYKTAASLAIYIIAYNIIERLVSIWFSVQDETLVLSGSELCRYNQLLF